MISDEMRAAIREIVQKDVKRRADIFRSPTRDLVLMLLLGRLTLAAAIPDTIGVSAELLAEQRAAYQREFLTAFDEEWSKIYA